MSTALGNCDLQLMAKYDFKAPINTTVIIFDSDEDDKPLNEKEECRNDVAKNIDNIISDSFEYERKTTNRKNQKTANTRKRTTSEVNNDKRIQEAKNYTKDVNTDLVQNQADVLSMAHTANNIDYNQKIPREDQSSNSNQISITTSQESSETNTLVCTPQINISQNEDDINKTANKCLKTLLDTVSTHMIFIMQAYADYALIARTTTDRAALEMARKHYQDTKYNFFYLSFSAVANIMLPKENNKAFMDNFIENTIKLAYSKKLYFNHSYSYLTMLCGEMMNWAKPLIQPPLLPKCPVLTELLNKEPQPTVLTTNNYQKQSCNNETYSSDNICIFKSGPVGREFSINVNSTAIQNSQNTMPQYNNTTHVPMHTVPSRQSLLPPTPKDELRNNANSRNYLQEFQNFNADYNIFSCTPNNKKKPSRGSEIKRKEPKTKKHPSTPLQTSRPSPTPYYSTNTCHYETVMPPAYSENHFSNSVNYNSVQVHQGQEEVNRSMSRDSGFMSPLSSASNYQMCSSPGQEHMDSTSGTPMITHVTSLNPSVAYIKDGICHVCGKLTKQKCLGCYKFYYCSHHCQFADWKYHIYQCK